MIGAVLSQVLCLSLGWLYPMYFSFKALKEKDTEQISRLLAFWIVIAGFTFAEYTVELFISWLPLFYEAKVALVAWLVAHNFRGANLLYSDVIMPTLERHEADLDKALEDGKEAAKAKGVQYGKAAVDLVRTKSQELLVNGQAMLLEQIAQRQTGTGGGGGRRAANNGGVTIEEMDSDGSEDSADGTKGGDDDGAGQRRRSLRSRRTS